MCLNGETSSDGMFLNYFIHCICVIQIRALFLLTFWVILDYGPWYGKEDSRYWRSHYKRRQSKVIYFIFVSLQCWSFELIFLFLYRPCFWWITCDIVFWGFWYRTPLMDIILDELAYNKDSVPVFLKVAPKYHLSALPLPIPLTHFSFFALTCLYLGLDEVIMLKIGLRFTFKNFSVDIFTDQVINQTNLYTRYEGLPLFI